MKINKKDNKLLSDSIDQIEDGLNKIVDLYNNSEEDQPFIKWDSELITNIEKAKKIYGDEFVNIKINNLVKEVISFLPLDEYDDEENNIEPIEGEVQ